MTSTRTKKVVHCKRAPFDIYIGRPSKWGNPFVIGRDGNREQVVEKYRAYILGNQALLAAKSELTRNVLGCWCAPQICHGDVLTALAKSHPRSQTTGYAGGFLAIVCC